MNNDFILPPDLSPEAREAFTRAKAAIERTVAQTNLKPYGWATIESQRQLQEELNAIAASYPGGTVGTCSSGGHDPLEIRQYRGFIIAIYVFRKLNDQYSTLSGIRKAGAPIPQEPFPMSKDEFPTHEAAVKAALDECRSKIDSEECG